MFLIPYGSDAILYHLPIVTVAMILVNTLVFLVTNGAASSMPDQEFIAFIEPWILQYGCGLKPWQWVTTNFLHGGWMHLIGNMCAMWGFGFVVEGKIGWWRYLILFLGIGVLQSAAQQVVMLGADGGGALGASSIVFGLLAVCMVWAPANETQCVLFLFFRVFFIRMTFYMLAVVLLALQLLGIILSGMQWGSEVLHLFGAVTGFAVGVFMFKKGWVDCEGWDLFSVWSDNAPQEAAKEKLDSEAQDLLERATEKRISSVAEQPLEPDPTLADDLFNPPSLDDLSALTTVDDARSNIESALATGDATGAFALLKEHAELYGVQVFERELVQIISGLNGDKRWEEVIPAMVLYIKHFSGHEVPIRIRLAHLLLTVRQQPAQAQSVLKPIAEQSLTESQRSQVRSIWQKAQAAQKSQRSP